MTAPELKEHLKYLGWSQAELARRVTVDKNTVTRWMKSGVIPGATAAFVEIKVKARKMGE